jgi:tetratricopeptide (TPR) repeat protein
MVIPRRATGDHDAAIKCGQKALTIARTLGDRSIEAVATNYLGDTHLVRGEFSEAVKLLERNIELDGKLRAQGFGIATALAYLGRFDEAIGHGEAAVRIAEETDDPFTLLLGLCHLGLVHLIRGDFPRAARILERCLQLGRTWQFIDRTPDVAAFLGYAYALAGRTEESLALVAGAVKAFHARHGHVVPAGILLFAVRAYLAAGRIDEATNYAREVLALTRQLGARGLESMALFLTADVAAASGDENPEGYYREALALAEPRGMRPQVAHCHFGLGKLYRRRGNREQAQKHLTTAMAMYREMGMTYWLGQAKG